MDKLKEYEIVAPDVEDLEIPTMIGTVASLGTQGVLLRGLLRRGGGRLTAIPCRRSGTRTRSSTPVLCGAVGRG